MIAPQTPGLISPHHQIQELEVVQIVPRLPPYTDGVGDYALRLGEQLWQDHHIRSHFLAFCTGLEFTPLNHGFSISSLKAHTAEALLQAVPDSAQAIMLHYSNYPYLQGPLDAPFWFPKALKILIQQRHIPLMVMFHELPTLQFKSLRFLHPLQLQISRQLTQLANQTLTDSARFKEQLSRWTPHPIPCIPDFSNVGEPASTPPLCDRQRRLVIFGGHDRGRIYRNHLRHLLHTCQQLNLQEIVDIGSPLNLDIHDFEGVQMTQMGFQPATTVSEILLASFAGMIDYTRFPGDLGKSSVFAAFTAHGLLPLSTTYNPSEADGIHLNQHYLTPQTLAPHNTATQLQAIATSANTWYSNHSLQKNTEVFAQHLAQMLH